MMTTNTYDVGLAPAPALTMAKRKGLRWNAAAIAVAPTAGVLLVAVYGFLLWSLVVSFTDSQFAPSFNFVGLEQYVRLWQNDRWQVSAANLLVFSLSFVAISVAMGLLLAILLDQKVRAEGVLRVIYLYPMAISLIVTGTAWKWILNPELGLEKLLLDLGFQNASFDWLINPERAVYTLVIAAVWQTVGFVMAIFLAALRGVDEEIIKAARLEGASITRIYWSIILPMMRAPLFTVMVILIYQAVRSYDLVVSLTNGGPGYSSDLPTTFMFNLAFKRGQLAQGSASAMMILLTVIVIIVPYLLAEMRHEKRHSH